MKTDLEMGTIKILWIALILFSIIIFFVGHGINKRNRKNLTAAAKEEQVITELKTDTIEMSNEQYEIAKDYPQNENVIIWTKKQ